MDKNGFDLSDYPKSSRPECCKLLQGGERGGPPLTRLGLANQPPPRFAQLDPRLTIGSPPARAQRLLPRSACSGSPSRGTASMRRQGQLGEKPHGCHRRRQMSRRVHECEVRGELRDQPEAE